MISIISAVMTWITALTGLVFGYKSWRNSKLDAVKQFMEAENSEELFQARHELYHCKYLGEMQELSATKISSHYHFWGLMVKRGYLPIWVFDGEPGESAIQLYYLLEGYIKKRRCTKTKYAENFTWLILKIEKRNGE